MSRSIPLFCRRRQKGFNFFLERSESLTAAKSFRKKQHLFPPLKSSRLAAVRGVNSLLLATLVTKTSKWIPSISAARQAATRRRSKLHKLSMESKLPLRIRQTQHPELKTLFRLSLHPCFLLKMFNPSYEISGRKTADQETLSSSSLSLLQLHPSLVQCSKTNKWS